MEWKLLLVSGYPSHYAYGDGKSGVSTWIGYPRIAERRQRQDWPSESGFVFVIIFAFTTYRLSQVREDIKVLLEALPEEERNIIFDPKKGGNKPPAKHMD